MKGDERTANSPGPLIIFAHGNAEVIDYAAGAFHGSINAVAGVGLIFLPVMLILKVFKIGGASSGNLAKVSADVVGSYRAVLHPCSVCGAVLFLTSLPP